MSVGNKKVEFLVVDTTAFIKNAQLQEITDNPVTVQEVVDEIKNKRQVRRLVALPYDLQIKDVFPENVKIVTDFTIKTGDYRSLSATDIKVMALTYQLEKEKVGTDHIRTEPLVQRSVQIETTTAKVDMSTDVSGFYMPGKPSKILDENTLNIPGNEEESHDHNDETTTEELAEKFQQINCNKDVHLENNADDVLVPLDDNSDDEAFVSCSDNSSGESEDESEDDDDDSGWITPSNVQVAKKLLNSDLIETKEVKVACMTTDFAMQNVLKQMNLNVAALDGKMIKQLRTFILRCHTCFKTTSIMTKLFCPKCGNNTLKKVAYSLDDKGEMQIHINGRKPLTARGKKFSLPKIKGGKHPNNPVLVEDQPMAQNRASKLAQSKINPLDDDYIAGFSPFATRDVYSKSAQLCIRPGTEIKYFMRKNPNEARRKRK